MCLSLPFVQPAVEGAAAACVYLGALPDAAAEPRQRELASADPMAPLVDPNYLSEPIDLDSLVAAVTLAREIGAPRRLPIGGPEVYRALAGWTLQRSTTSSVARRGRFTIPSAPAASAPLSTPRCASKA